MNAKPDPAQSNINDGLSPPDSPSGTQATPITEPRHQADLDNSPVSDPGIDRVYKYLMFGISLPERAVRSTSAMIGGALNESAELLVPRAFQDSKTYNTFVKQMLDVMSNSVGGVGSNQADDEDVKSEPDVKNYVARKTVSTFVDLAGMATMHVSPLTILAIVGDVAYGSKTYLNELADELKREGIIDANSSISSAAELLDAVGNASCDTADAFDMPPVSVEGLRETILRTRESVANIDPALLIPKAEIDRLWGDMQKVADQENVNVFEISSAMTMYTLGQVNTVSKGALTTIRVTGSLVDRHLFDHYRQGIYKIQERGMYTMLAESSQPYLDAVWFNFSVERPTVTEDIVSGKMAGRVWGGIKGWLGTSKPDDSNP